MSSLTSDISSSGSRLRGAAHALALPLTLLGREATAGLLGHGRLTVHESVQFGGGGGGGEEVGSSRMVGHVDLLVRCLGRYWWLGKVR